MSISAAVFGIYRKRCLRVEGTAGDLLRLRHGGPLLSFGPKAGLLHQGSGLFSDKGPAIYWLIRGVCATAAKSPEAIATSQLVEASVLLGVRRQAERDTAFPGASVFEGRTLIRAERVRSPKGGVALRFPPHSKFQRHLAMNHLFSLLMKLYFLRHGKADWPDWDRPDDERPLTKNGRHEMRRIAKFLAKSKVKPGALLSSPLPRASETAEIAGKALGLEVRLDRALGKSFNLMKLRPLLQQFGGEDLMLVGHDPNFTTVIKALTGADLKLGKGGLARVDLANPKAAKGKLIWLIPPKVGRA